MISEYYEESQRKIDVEKKLNYVLELSLTHLPNLHVEYRLSPYTTEIINITKTLQD